MGARYPTGVAGIPVVTCVIILQPPRVCIQQETGGRSQSPVGKPGTVLGDAGVFITGLKTRLFTVFLFPVSLLRKMTAWTAAPGHELFFSSSSEDPCVADVLKSPSGASWYLSALCSGAGWAL